MQGFTVPDSDRIEAPMGGPRVRQVIPPAPTSPRQPTPQTPAQAEKDQLEVAKLKQDLAKKDPSRAAFREPADKILNVIDAAANAHRLSRSGIASSPIGRYVTGKVPGTTARDIQGYLDTIGGNTAFETLSQMRQESPTGGAVGNVSDKDLQLLRSTIAALDPSQSNKKFQRDLSTVLRSYQKVLYKLPGGKEAYHNWRVGWLGYDPEKRGRPVSNGGGKPRVIDFNDLP